MNPIFESALKTGNIAGAYIVEGQSEQTIRQEIDSFLLRVFCENGSGCGSCSGCKKYINGVHADVLSIDSKGKTIKIDEVREIPSVVANKSYEGGIKAVVIGNAHLLTVQAQNALLKVLEEPPPDTVMLLGVQNSKNILPTILSRCIILKIRGSFQENDLHMLMQEYSLPTLKARTLLNAAGGDMNLAKQYMDAGFFEIRDDMVQLTNKLLLAKNMATSAMEKLLLAHEEELKLAMRCFMQYLGDVLLKKHGQDTIINEDKLQEIQNHAKATDYKITNIMQKCNDFMVMREQCAGLNVKLAILSMLLMTLEVII